MNVKQIIFIAVALFGLLSCGNKTTTKSDDPIVYRQADDPELEQAKQEAISNLDYFIKSFNSHSTDSTYHFSLKTDFVENDEHEHMWITLIKIENGHFQGILDSDPQLVKNVKYGDFVQIVKEQIEDWIIFYGNSDNYEGGYSVKVLQSRE